MQVLGHRPRERATILLGQRHLGISFNRKPNGLRELR